MPLTHMYHVSLANCLVSSDKSTKEILREVHTPYPHLSGYSTDLNANVNYFSVASSLDLIHRFTIKCDGKKVTISFECYRILICSVRFIVNLIDNQILLLTMSRSHIL